MSELSINENHSHALHSADILHYRKPSEIVKSEFVELFNSGLAPAAAYNKFTENIESECGSYNEWIQRHCDRSQVPDLPWVYKFFSKKFEEKYGSQGSYEVVMNNLKTFLQDKEDFCRFKELKDDFVIAICTALMQRISTLPTAGELVFLDATGGVDRFGFKVFPLIVNTKAGGCPIGVLITTSETITVISEALSLYLTFVNEHSFGGRGKRGPKCFITDDCEAEIVVLRNTFPEAILLLCIFHFMKAVYQWLRKSQNGVPGKDQLIVYDLIKKMVYAETEEVFHSHYLKLSELPCTKENKKVKDYFSKEYAKRKQWALCYRYTTDVIVRGSYTNNYAERAMRIIKEEILNRRQALCPSQLVDYFTVAYDNRYKRSITDIAIDKNCNHLKRKSKLNDVEEFEKKYEVKELMANIYKVLKKDLNVRYIVDAQVGCCSCYMGINGGLCKHIKFLTLKLGLEHPLQYPTTAAEKKNLYYIATGENMAEEFFVGPHDKIGPVSQDDFPTEVPPISENSTHTEVLIEDGVPPAHSTDGENINQDSATLMTSHFFTNFRQEVDMFCEKFKGRVDVAEALNQAALELKKLRNGTAANAISALKCFNRNLSYRNLYMRNSKKIGINSVAIQRRKKKMSRFHKENVRPDIPPTPEHGYSKLGTKRMKQPHALSVLVQRNLG